MDIIERPIITEKTMILATKGWYTFKVKNNVSKNYIASLVRSLYHVDVVDVRSSNIKGKSKRRGKKMKYVKASDSKKVYVKLKKGQSIEIFQQVANEAKKV